MAVGNIPGVATAPLATRDAGQPPPARAAAKAGPSPSSSQAVSFDPADTNHDGVVSPEEALAYALAHPELASRNAPQAGGAYGADGTAPPPQRGLLDLRA